LDQTGWTEAEVEVEVILLVDTELDVTDADIENSNYH
jgi:hypothetical protein